MCIFFEFGLVETTNQSTIGVHQIGGLGPAALCPPGALDSVDLDRPDCHRMGGQEFSDRWMMDDGLLYYDHSIVGDD